MKPPRVRAAQFALTRRQYGRIMRRFRKGALRAIALALLLAPMHAIGKLAGAAAAPLKAALLLLGGIAAGMLLASILGMVLAWAMRLRARAMTRHQLIAMSGGRSSATPLQPASPTASHRPCSS